MQTFVKNTIRMELDKIEAIANIIGSREKFDVAYALDVLKAESKRLLQASGLCFLPMEMSSRQITYLSMCLGAAITKKRWRVKAMCRTG